MTSINTKLEDTMKSNDDSLSMAPYNNFNSLTAEDSMEQIRKRNTEISSHTAETTKPVARGWTSKKFCYKLIDVVAIVVIIIVLWLIMALPTAFYIHHTTTTGVSYDNYYTEYGVNRLALLHSERRIPEGEHTKGKQQC